MHTKLDLKKLEEGNDTELAKVGKSLHTVVFVCVFLFVFIICLYY